MLKTVLEKLSTHQDLSMEETSDAIDAIVSGGESDAEIGILLTLLHEKGETSAELAGAADALRKHMVPIHSARRGLVDTCGTGGDGSSTFNISTAAALVTAAAGVPVAKHGNRKITSKTGSADVLAALGVNIDASVVQVEACLDELGICFCFAPLMHPAMKQVAQVRRTLGFPTIFNMIGPLANPAGAPFQLVGVGKNRLRTLLAQALKLLGTEHALVVHGGDGLDEVTLADRTEVIDVAGGTVSEHTWSPEEFGLKRAPLDAMVVETPDESAEMIRKLLAGDRGTPRDIVVLNSAAALITAGAAGKPLDAARTAAEAIDSGAAGELLARLAERSYA